MAFSYRSLSIFISCCLLALASFGQGWERTVGDDQNQGLSSALQAANDDFIATGYTIITGATERSLWATRVNVNGNEVWQTSTSLSGYNLTGIKILELANNESLILAEALDANSISALFLWQIDAAGNSLNETLLDSINFSIKDACLKNSTFLYAVGHENIPIAGGPLFHTDALVLEINLSNPELTPLVNIGGTELESFTGVTFQPDGSAGISGYTSSTGNGNFDILFVKLDATGNIVAENTFGSEAAELGQGLTFTNSQYLITGSIDSGNSDGKNPFILVLDQLGDSLAMPVIVDAAQSVPQSIIAQDNGEFWISGTTQGAGLPNIGLWIFDSALELSSTNTFGGLGNDGTRALIAHGTNQALIAGTSNSFSTGDTDGYLINLDADGNSFTATISGNIFWDENLNCLKEPAELELENWILELSGTINLISASDEFGNYSFEVPVGNYILNVIPTNDYWTPCEENISANITSNNDNLVLAHPVQATTECPLLIVDIGTPFLRRCFPNTYSVEICNQGTADAENATVEIEFDEFLEIQSSTLAWNSQTGNIYEFELGTLAALDCINFQVEVLVNCDSTELGQTHCTIAHAYPDTLCDPINSTWDGSSLSVSGICTADSVIFTITNIGTGTSSNTQGYIIVEDDLLFYEGELEPIIPQGDTSFTVPATGGTWHIEVMQSPGHPGNDMPSFTIEGCGGLSTGYYTQFPQNDGNPFVDIDCRQNVGSYDPNDKTGYPTGYADEHFILANTNIEYNIRFQNTGTDTAFTVILRDTLPETLDISSLRMGASSHEYRWSLSGNNILEIAFENIMLPDSTVNEIASNGFVKFTIDQREDLANGTTIENQAGIYFDFNAPIITNKTLHTIGQNFITSSVTPGVPASEKFLAYPNPFSEQVTFVIPENWVLPLELSIFNNLGQMVHVVTLSETHSIFKANQLSPGVYFFNIKNDRELLVSGKIILQ